MQKFVGSVNFYYMNFENEIVPSGGLDVFGQPRVGNAGKTHHIGIELEGVYKLPWDFQSSSSTTRVGTVMSNLKEYDGNGTVISRNDNYIANAPELILNMGLTYLNENFFAVVNVNHTGVQ